MSEIDFVGVHFMHLQNSLTYEKKVSGKSGIASMIIQRKHRETQKKKVPKDDLYLDEIKND